MADEDDSQMLPRLASHSAYFNSLVQLVPTKFYLPDNEKESSSKFYKNRGKDAPKQEIKDASRKAKKRRLDPKQPKSALDLQDDENLEKGSSDSGEEEAHSNEVDFSVEKVPSGKISDLRARLHERIEMLQVKRKASSNKPKKQVERQKKKTKSEIKLDKKKQNETARWMSEQNEKKTANPAGNRVFNEQGEVVFSKFDFMERSKAPKHGSKTRNYKNLLAKAEARKKKIEGLKVQDARKAKEMEERFAWKGALEKAEGIKQKDDPKLLKKSLKRREKHKERSKKQWNSRKDQQQKQAEEKQKLRQKHLKERSEAKKGKKSGKGKSKKHKPGF